MKSFVVGFNAHMLSRCVPKGSILWPSRSRVSRPLCPNQGDETCYETALSLVFFVAGYFKVLQNMWGMRQFLGEASVVLQNNFLKSNMVYSMGMWGGHSVELPFEFQSVLRRYEETGLKYEYYRKVELKVSSTVV